MSKSLRARIEAAANKRLEAKTRRAKRKTTAKGRDSANRYFVTLEIGVEERIEVVETAGRSALSRLCAQLVEQFGQVRVVAFERAEIA